MFINRALIYGNITKDPELKTLTSGSSVCNFSVATNRTWTGKDGKKQEDAQFHNIVCFGKTAENVAHYMHKGNSIYIEGRIQTRMYETKDGSKRYTTEIIAEQVQFGPKKVDSNNDNGKDDIVYDKNQSHESEISIDDLPF